MAYARTLLTGAVGEKYLGKPAPNKADDVRKLQTLFRKVFGSRAPAFKDGVYDDAVKEAITRFQSAWGGTPDGTVDPHGQTLKRIDRLANPLTLKPITLARVLEAYDKGKLVSDGGGYRIAYGTCDGGPLPPAASGYSPVLTVMTDANAIDVGGRPAYDVMNLANLAELLGIFDRLGVWGGVPVQIRIQLRYGPDVVTTSDPQLLTTPLLPHNGRMLPLDEENNGPKLTYQGDPAAADFHGRMFVQVPGFSKNLFVWAGQFETRNENRGFDCITYVGTTCGASNFHMAESADLAASLNATTVSVQHTEKDKKGKDVTTTVQLEQAEPKYVKEFFAGTAPDDYLMWSGGHIVLVSGGNVYEFKASEPSGYNCTPVDDWLEPYKQKRLTVRKLPERPARAN
ncbi:Peptidoglycan-binding domain 1 protein [Gemmatirosa kalamazoonensis]|uniref:Peptidoglycan-binding domain 1 protein n=1 Tax=Gemmatirosa kalamazoonensis TaxID=861299 RepID=W0RH12_9BACT|nr:peptidoglycan-binding protein [Gemmatirosa kalamazoonensis]AHG90076.1 Peptidoglycan-binding domain 1 protein [Gemmatirosa kalamazoonensis]